MKVDIRTRRLQVEHLEPRTLLSATAQFHHIIFSAGDGAPLSSSSPPSTALTPAQVCGAYGINNIQIGSVTGTGAGQTIAIVDAYNDPTIASDLATFDSAFDLPAPPSLTQVNESGSTSPLPGTDPNGPGSSKGTWEEEESLDVEWATCHCSPSKHRSGRSQHARATLTYMLASKPRAT